MSNFFAYYPATPDTVIISGTVTANQGTSPWVENVAQFGGNDVITGTGASGLGIPRVTVSNDSNILATQSGTWSTGRTWTLSDLTDSVSIGNFPSTFAVTQGTSPWVISGAVSATQSGTWNINNISGIISLPTGAATETTLAALNAKFSSLGQKVMASSAPVVIASDQTSIPVAATQTTSPWVVSGTVAATQSGTWNIGTVTTITNPVAVTQSTSPWVISGTVTANAGTNLNTSLLALDASVNGILLAQASTTSGQTGPLIQGAVTTSAPAYTTAKTSPLSLTTTGALRVDGSASTQPISGTVTANQGGAPWSVSGSGNFTVVQATAASLNATVTGTVAATQSGTWNIGTVTTLTSITNPVAVTQSGTWSTRTLDGAGNSISSTSNALNVSVQNSSLSVTQGTSPWVVSGTVATTQSTSPWVSNITQFGSNNVATGTGTGGVGIPRVTVSNDSNILATQSGTWNIGTVTTLTSITNSVAVTQSTSPWVISGAVTATLAAETTKVIGTVNVSAGQTIAVTNTGTFATQATLAAETTKVIGTINVAASQTIAVTNTGTFATQSTLASETTKVIGVVRNADGSGNLLTSTSFNSKQGLDVTPNMGFSTASNTRVAVDNSVSVQLLAANLNRKYVYIMNNTGKAYYLKLGAAAVVGQGILLSNNGMYELTGDNLWTGTVNAISSSSTSTSLDIFEGTP